MVLPGEEADLKNGELDSYTWKKWLYLEESMENSTPKGIAKGMNIFIECN